MKVPARPRIYHIVHVDKLPSILEQGCLWSDAEVFQRQLAGTQIGMAKIKQRRLQRLLVTYPELTVGACVPFYFCPRSVMLFVIHKGNSDDLQYRGGQDPIVHLEVDLHGAVAWAAANGLRWVFTNSNAASAIAEEFSDLADLHRIDWQAVAASDWRHCREAKQAEFLIEQQVPWQLVSRIGVLSDVLASEVRSCLDSVAHRPNVEVQPDWYYPSG